LASILTHLKQT